MDIPELIQNLLSDYTLRTVALGSLVLGIVSGTLGAYAVLRRQSLLGDAMSHAALPGIAIAYLLTGSKDTLVLILGAGISGWIATLFIMNIVGWTRIKYDSALGMVLSVFFGFGLVLLTIIQKKPDATQAGLDKFLFGQAAALLMSDVISMAILGSIALVLVFSFWKEFKLLSFDPEFGATVGFPMRTLDILLTTLIVLAIVLGLQTVGVVLMSAMIVAPGAAARQWTDNLGKMVTLSGFFGAVGGVSGAVISSTVPRVPTGPTIVLCLSALVLISMLFAPRRGIIWSKIEDYKNRSKLRLDVILEDLYTLALEHKDMEHAHESSVLKLMGTNRGGISRNLRELESRGYVKRVNRDKWALTSSGIKEALRLRAARGVRP